MGVTSAYVAHVTSAQTIAYDRPSCAYFWTCGRTANASPARRPARGPARRRPRSVTPAAAEDIARAEGSRSVSRPSPRTVKTACITA
ncbi:hypothetical protein [Streptomyces acidiscabies]|uniref:hypothetical protein n=1 Tax=Streptomyces acidiscabies TaxID=42234 RepID=UPI000287FDD8